MKKTICTAITIMLLASILTLSSTGVGEVTNEISITDARGETINFDSPPERIISFMASNTEIFFYLGQGHRVIAVDDFSNHPMEVDDLPKVGNAFEVNYELIVSLEPDVIVTAFYNEDMINALENYGETVVATRSTDIDDLYDDMIMLGTMCGIEEAARSKADSLSSSMDDLYRELPAEERPGVLLVVDTFGGIWTTGQGTFQDTMITNAGARNIASDKNGWQVISEEEILMKNPDIIIATESLRDGLKEYLNKGSWAHISALEEDQIYYIHDDLISRPGPRIVEAQEFLVDTVAEVSPKDVGDEETPWIGGAVLLGITAILALVTERRNKKR